MHASLLKSAFLPKFYSEKNKQTSASGLKTIRRGLNGGRPPVGGGAADFYMLVMMMIMNVIIVIFLVCGHY